MKRSYPPVARMMPIVFRVLRVLGVLLLVLGLWVAWLLMDDGEVVAGTLVGISVGAFVAVTWLNPLSPGFRIAFAIAVLALVGLGGPAFAVGVVFAAIALYLFYRFFRIKVDPESVRALDPQAVMRPAQPAVDEFRRHGWQQIGAVGFTVLRRTVIESILIPPQVDRYAQVTDAVWAITSQIDDIRTLVTRNSGRSAVPDHTLSNDLTGASPAELIEGHEVALQVLSNHGAEAVPLVAGQIVDQVVRDEKAAIGAGLRRRGRDDPSGPIDDSLEAGRRIRAWLGTPTID